MSIKMITRIQVKGVKREKLTKTQKTNVNNKRNSDNKAQINNEKNDKKNNNSKYMKLRGVFRHFHLVIFYGRVWLLGVIILALPGRRREATVGG